MRNNETRIPVAASPFDNAPTMGDVVKYMRTQLVDAGLPPSEVAQRTSHLLREGRVVRMLAPRQG